MVRKKNKSTRSKPTTRRRSPARGTLHLRDALIDAFRKRFPKGYVDVSDGYQGNVHVLVVSRELDSLTDTQKADILDRTLNDAGLSRAQIARVTLLLGYSPDEIK